MRSFIVDCQILQTKAFDRGMGKYTQSLLGQIIAKNLKYHKYKRITLVFNKNLDQENLDHIKFLKSHKLDIRFLDLPNDITEDTNNRYRSAIDELTRFMNTEYGEDKVDFLITCPFFVDFAATFPRQEKVRKMSLVYDLIPHNIINIQKIFPDEIYFRHYQTLIEADQIFTISEAVKNDLIDIISIEPDKITNINGGAFKRDKPVGKQLAEFDKPFILMPSAPIIHKNNERAIRAFLAFNQKKDNRYTLYITSDFDENSRKTLPQDAKVKFTGHISDSDLAAAYSVAEAVFVPSLAEGLGLPALEAVLNDTPVACSDIPVLNEMSEGSFYLFDPGDTSSIASSLILAVDKQNWTNRRKKYSEIEKKYTWSNSAERILSSPSIHKPTLDKKKINILVNGNSAGVITQKILPRFMKIYDIGVVARSINHDLYLKYLDLPPVTDSDNMELMISDNVGLLSKFKKKHVVVLYKRNDTINKLRFFVRLKLVEPLLKFKNWFVYDKRGRMIPPSDLSNEIMKLMS